MSRPALSQAHIHALFNLFDWSGHVELGENDKHWLAGELAAALSGGETAACEVCGYTKVVVIGTALGNICEDCIEAMSDEVEQMREDLEGGADDSNSDPQRPTSGGNRTVRG